VEYTTISKPLRTVSESGKIEVREYFWYGCPHCFRLEPFVQRWLDGNPQNVNFQMQPAILGESWAPAAQAFYTAALLGVLDKVHPAFFDEIHVKGNRNLAKNELAIELLFEQSGVTPEQFRKTWGSFGVQSRVKQAYRMTRQANLQGVPAVVVNGKYLTDPGSAGSYEQMFKVIEFLVAKEMAAAK
ncbi:MAG TPA: thiol:disulfide interchange protein DsbA/DsbL, partial [Gammaproteobacteria bacterium]|nr:thiol:disulfide interchange protein DsbA/DsbL [Gammaproteobacteria bacterium]